ncbi:MAG: hypothetical protein R3C59_24790 [Planctomycetaceae bacterium]
MKDLRAELTALPRRLVDRCQSAANMTDAKRRALGITIRKTPTRHPVPKTFPVIEFRSQRLNTVEFALRDSAQREGRTRKPAGVRGATLYTHLGDQPPTSLSDWTVWGTTTNSVNEISMPHSVRGDVVDCRRLAEHSPGTRPAGRSGINSPGRRCASGCCFQRSRCG